MPRPWQSEEQEDFTGGITDYVDSAKPNQSALLENFVVARDGSIEVRHGSDIWNVNPLPSSLTALQLFQLEEYIFAYTSDGDVYHTNQDGSESWTQILTAADINNNFGSDRLLSGSDVLYIIPDDTMQASKAWAELYFRVIVTTVADANPNVLTITTDTGSGTSLNFIELNFEYHTLSGTTDFIWTSAHTAALEAGYNSSLPWTVALNDTVLNGTSHDDITIDTVVGVDVTSAGTTNFLYRPIYFYRVMPFVDSSYNGVLSVSKFNGHLYLSLFPDDRDYTVNASDKPMEFPDIYEVDNKRVPLRKIYLLYDSDTQTAQPRLTSAQLPPLDLAARLNSGSLGTEDNLYIYEAYARHTYEALVEGEPRTFIADGPSVQDSISTQYDFYDAGNSIKVSARMLPRCQMAFEIIPLKEITIEFFRSTKNDVTLHNLSSTSGNNGVLADDWSTLFDASTDTDLQEEWSGLDSGDPDRGLFFMVGVTTTFNRIDSATDADILGNEQPYDSGNLLPYVTIPQGPYYFTIANQIGYYADVFKLKNRVYQSIYGIPHATIATAFLEFEDGITGIKTFRDNAIVTTLDSLWRMEGIRGQTGAGTITQRLISDEFGAISNASIVVTNYGLFFLSRTGICYTDGFKALRVSEQLFDTYFNWSEDTDYIRSFYHESEQKVYWSINYNGKSRWIILHLRFGIHREMAITTASGLSYLNIPALASEATTVVDRFDTNVCLVNNLDQKLLRHQSGTILKHDVSYTTDYYPPNSEYVPIPYQFKSRAFNAGSKRFRKWYANAIWIMKEYADKGVTCQPLGYNDLSPVAKKLSPCFHYDSMTWGDSIQTWGNPDVSYNASKIVKFRRMFPQGAIRATYKQFGLESLYVYGSDSYTHGSGTYSSSIDSGAYRTSITIPISLATAALEMEGATVTGNGQFAIMLPGIWGKRWLPIHKVIDNTTSFDVYIDSDTDATNDLTVANTDWALGYIRIAERIGLDYLSMRFTVIGENTDGASRDSDGGDEGGGELS